VSKRFPELPAGQTAAQLEEAVLALWEREGLFARAQAARAGGPPFVFYEGPPTANGRPGIHHVFARTVKDLVCRHRAMRGHDVPRKAGWDTHGLPVEIEVEKRLGISGKQDIERVGVAEFNRLCRESVFTYREEWERLSARMGYWLDYARPYVTFSNEYVESVWWALATLHGRGLLYQGHKILPYCPRCETALSSHEVAQGYKDVEGPSVYVALDLVHDGPGRRRIVVWTTTPWTLVSNTALAVNPELTYAELRKKGAADWTIVLAEARTAGVLGPTGRTAGTWSRPCRARTSWGALPPAAGLDRLPRRRAERRRARGDRRRGVRERGGRLGRGAHGAGVRRGRLRGRAAARARVRAAGGHARPLRRVGARGGRREGARRERAHRGRAPGGRPAVEGGHAHAQLPALLALRHPAAVLRALVVVRAHHGVQGRDARAQRARRLAPRGGRGRAVRQWLENNVDWAVSRDRYWGTPLPCG
jgi:isoleucyl-tRNA synthetase